MPALDSATFHDRFGHSEGGQPAFKLAQKPATPFGLVSGRGPIGSFKSFQGLSSPDGYSRFIVPNDRVLNRAQYLDSLEKVGFFDPSREESARTYYVPDNLAGTVPEWKTKDDDALNRAMAFIVPAVMAVVAAPALAASAGGSAVAAGETAAAGEVATAYPVIDTMAGVTSVPLESSGTLSGAFSSVKTGAQILNTGASLSRALSGSGASSPATNKPGNTNVTILNGGKNSEQIGEENSQAIAGGVPVNPSIRQETPWGILAVVAGVAYLLGNF